jgi:hypothetical protein
MRIAVGVAAILACGLVSTQDPPKKWEKQPAAHKYVGVATCSMCHDSKTKSKAHEKWSTEDHAKAYKTLASDKAKEIGKACGIEDPQKSPDCLKCHTVGYGNEEKWFDKDFTLAEGVSCEACHGPGDDYMPKAIHGKDRQKAVAKGLLMPTEATCRNCHNEESPTFKDHPFDYKERRKKIMHWEPKEIDK